MAVKFRIKRRAAGGATGAPASLENAELAYNEADQTLYIGEGTGGAGGTATSIVAIAGPGKFALLSSPTFTGTPLVPTAAADTNTTQAASTAFVLGQASASNPIMNGAVAVGTSLRYARADHVHPVDTSRAPLASPTFTGVPAGPTAVADTNTTQLATTAFVLGQAFSSTPTMNGAGTSGTSLRYARGDHVHPTDTSRAPLASPALTGTPTAPTAAVDTSTTQLATTAFVLAQASASVPSPLGTASAGASSRYARADHVHGLPTHSQLGAPTADVNWGSFKITNLADPVNAQDAATKNYVDNAVQGLDAKASVKAASTLNQALSGGTAFPTIDGVTTAAGDRVLLKDQTTTNQNGIYVVGGTAGAWTLSRATDADSWTELVNAYVWVEQGTTNADSAWVCTVDQGGVLGTTAVAWAQFSGAAQISAGNGLTKTGNTLDVVGTTNRISVTADAVDIAATYVGQTSLTTLGTITTGTWQGSIVAVTYGGTGAASLTGYVKGNGTAAMTASATIPNTDITGLGTMSTQNASAVAITGGSIDGITFDGGTF